MTHLSGAIWGLVFYLFY